MTEQSNQESNYCRHETPGLAEEVRLIMDLVLAHAKPWLEGILAASQEVAEKSPCGWCPLCAIAGAVAERQPEFAGKAAEQATQMLALLRAVLADRWQPAQAPHMPGFRPTPQNPPGAGKPGKDGRVQHIPVQPTWSG